MALTIDGSTPAIAVSASNTTTTVTTVSFTPPNNSLLYVRWDWNTSAGDTPAAPAITDSLGVPLTYTLIDHKTRAAAGAVDGQCADWWANVTTGAAMTVTVTSGTGTNTQGGALHITVFTGHDPVTPIGAHGKSGSTSASSIAQNYTAQATGGQGFIGVTDWDLLGAQTAGTGCTLVNGGSGNAGTEISYGFVRRTTADDVNGNSNTLNVTIPGTSTNLSWVYAEIMPLAAASSARPTPIVVTPNQVRISGLAKVQRSTLQDPPVLTTAPPVVVIGSPGPRGVPRAGQTLRSTLQDPPVLTTAPPVIVTNPGLRLGVPNQGLTSRSSLADIVVVVGSTPAPTIVIGPGLRNIPNQGLTSRSGTESPAAAAIPPPVIVAVSGFKLGIPNQAFTGRSGTESLATVGLPAPVIVVGPGLRLGVPNAAQTSRHPTTFAETLSPSATTVISSQPQRLGQQAIQVRGTLQDFATPVVRAPLIVTPTPRAVLATPVILSRNLGAPLPLATVAIPAPIVYVPIVPQVWFTSRVITWIPRGQFVPVPPGPGPDPDFCAGPPFIDWHAAMPYIDWVAGVPYISWIAGPPEEEC